MKTVLAQKISEVIAKAELSPNRLAKAVGVSEEELLSWERGESVPSSTHLVRLALACGVEESSFFDESPPRPLKLFEDAGVNVSKLPPEARIAAAEFLDFLNAWEKFLNEVIRWYGPGERIVPLIIKTTLPPEVEFDSFFYQHPRIGPALLVNDPDLKNDLERYPKEVLDLVRQAVLDQTLSPSEASSLLGVDVPLLLHGLNQRSDIEGP